MAEDEEKILIFNAAGVKPPWWRRKRITFFYVDTPDYKADDLLEKYGVPVKYIGDRVKEDDGYIIVECRVKYEDVEDFLNVMHELQRLMLICGYRDYEEICREWVARMKEEYADE